VKLAVHNGLGKEKTEARGIRLPVWLWKQIEAVREKDQDQAVNDTVRKGLLEYCQRRLAA
jgi:hypothetical protein